MTLRSNIPSPVRAPLKFVLVKKKNNNNKRSVKKTMNVGTPERRTGGPKLKFPVYTPLGDLSGAASRLGPEWIISGLFLVSCWFFAVNYSSNDFHRLLISTHSRRRFRRVRVPARQNCLPKTRLRQTLYCARPVKRPKARRYLQYLFFTPCT